jgi:hypothetical protein
MRLKFFIALSVSSIIALQASEAAKMSCPTFEDVKASQHYNSAEEEYSYSANSSGGKIIPFTGTHKNPIQKEVTYREARVFGGGGRLLECQYVAVINGPQYDVSLRSHDKDAIALCKAISKGGDYFECQ